MKATASILMILVLLAGTGIAGPIIQQGPLNIGKAGPQREGRLVPDNRGRNRAPIQEVIEGLYVSRFLQELELNDDQFARVLPALRDSLRQRNQLGQRRSRALNALRRSIQEGASDDEINARVRDVDESDLALRAVQEKFFRSVDPELSPRQRGRLRIVQPNLEQRIRNLIDRSRNQGGRNPQ